MTHTHARATHPTPLKHAAQEPTKHQYDWDAATTISFLRKYNLMDDFKLNIECNHATLSGGCAGVCGGLLAAWSRRRELHEPHVHMHAHPPFASARTHAIGTCTCTGNCHAHQCAGHSCEHELETARINGVLGNIDANTGAPSAACELWLLAAGVANSLLCQRVPLPLYGPRACCPPTRHTHTHTHTRAHTHTHTPSPHAAAPQQATRRRGGTRTSSCPTRVRPRC
jgi:hypothetical protein